MVWGSFRPLLEDILLRHNVLDLPRFASYGFLIRTSVCRDGGSNSLLAEVEGVQAARGLLSGTMEMVGGPARIMASTLVVMSSTERELVAFRSTRVAESTALGEPCSS